MNGIIGIIYNNYPLANIQKNYGKSPFSIRTIIRSKKRGPYKVGHLSGHLNPIFKLIDNNMYIYLSTSIYLTICLSIHPSIYMYIYVNIHTYIYIVISIHDQPILPGVPIMSSTCHAGTILESRCNPI